MRASSPHTGVLRGLGLVLLCLGAWSGLATPAGAQAADTDVTILGVERWQYRWGDSPLDARGVPVWAYDTQATGWQPAPTLLTPPGDAQAFLWLRVRLPEVLPDTPTLGTRFLWSGVEVYLDSTRIYQAATLGPDPENKYYSVVPHFISLPAHAAGRVLSFRMYSHYGNVVGIPDAVYLSSEARLLQFALRNDLAILLIGGVLTFVGLLAFILLIKARERQRVLLLFYLGLLSFCFGINYVNSHVATHLIVAAPVFQYYLFGVFPLFPVGLLGFFEQMIGAGYKSIIRRLWQAHLAVWVVGVLLDVLNVLPFFLLWPVIFGLLAVSLLAMFVTVIPVVRTGRPEARIFGLGLVVAVVLGMFDTIFQGLLARFDLPELAPWGVLFFMLILGYLLERRFTENTRQLQVAHAQLAAYSATLEQRVEERTEELAQSLDELKAAQAQLIQSEKLASLGRLTAGIAHEIKNPLNFVNNFSQLSIELADELREEVAAHPDKTLADVADDLTEILDDLKRNAEKIHHHGQRADGIVRAMMQHARGGEAERRATDVNGLLEEFVKLAYHGMRAAAPDFNVALERDYDEAVGAVEVMPQEIGRVFLNLLNNAFYAVRERARSSDEAGYAPTVEVRTRRLRDRVEIRVVDNGAGIDAAIRERIFEPFFTTKPTGEGTGLGLSLSYEVVTQGHGGMLTVESNEEEGATFIVTLPVGTGTS